MDLDFVRIECEVIAETHAQLTLALFDKLRSIEVEFRAICCQFIDESCSSCRMEIDCAYPVLFNQKLSSDTEIIRLHQKPSLPFSLYISGIDGNSLSCTVGMVVVGTAVNYVEIYHSALLRMIGTALSSVLPHVDFTLRSYMLDYQSVQYPISTLPESVILLSLKHILNNTLHSDSLRLSLKSPLRLLCNGSIMHRFDFAAFFRSQLRRCSSLCAYYGSGELELDFYALSLAAQNVAVLEDGIQYTQSAWSKRQNRSGLIGVAEFTGLVEPMFSLLLLGSYFNAGKGATFGSGFHQIEVM